MMPAFIGAIPFRRHLGSLKSRFALCRRSTVHPTCTLAGQTTMIQSPDSDGPPGLDEYLNIQRYQAGLQGEPVTLGTGRANIGAFDGNGAAAALSALEKAKEGLGSDPQLCHCTVSLDVDNEVVEKTLKDALGSVVAVMGRSVNKKDSAGNIEILLLRSDSSGGITCATATVKVTTVGDSAAIDSACAASLREATKGALAKLDPASPCTFLIFAHTPGAAWDTARQTISVAARGIYAYGGPAVGREETGAGWGLLGHGNSGDENVQTAVVAAVPGKLSFLLSAVVKNWAQPVYAEPLSFMVPKYIGDPAEDLLTAIRYDDWDKFLWCIEERGVDVNHKWVNKQNQSPLLAACGRLRSRMVSYLIDHGADVHFRNNGGFTGAMYTRMLTDHDRAAVDAQLRLLENAGANTQLTEDEKQKLQSATNGRIVE